MQYVKNFSLIAIVSLFIISLVIHSALAQTAESLRSQIDQKQSEIDQIEQEIKNYQNQLILVGKEKDTLARAIKELDLTTKKLAADIQVTERKIDATLIKKKELTLSIETTSDTMGEHRNAIGQLIRNDNEQDSQTLIQSLLNTNQTLGTLWQYVDINTRIRAKFVEAVDTLQTEKKQLEGHKAEVEKNEATLRELKSSLASQKRSVDIAKQEKNKLLASTKNKESSYALLLKQKQDRKKIFEQELSSFESQLKFVLDPNSIPRSGSHIFSWPLDIVHITQFFGKTVAAKRLYVSGTHSGIDFGTPVGTPVHAVLSGTVIGTGNTDIVCPGASYGNWVFIRHDNGLSTVYGHLSLVAVQTGSRVTTGDIIAYSGNTGYSTGPHLHVSVFATAGVSIKSFPSKSCNSKILYTIPVASANAYLDPMAFFPAYNQ